MDILFTFYNIAFSALFLRIWEW